MEKPFESSPKKSLKYSLYDGAFFAVMDGLTASFLTPFAVALNLSVNLIAALTYVPQVVGAFAQLFATKLSEIIQSRKKIVLMGTLMQSILWLPLLLIPYISPNHSYLLLLYVSLSAMFVQMTQPTGTAWIGDLVPQNERGRFFGLRNKIVGICSFAATLLAGGLLIYLTPLHPFLGFTIIFSLAFASRLISTVFKSMMLDKPSEYAVSEKFTLVDFVKRMDKTNYGHFVIYIALFKLAVSIASPFFAVYMLKNLGFSYLQFTIITASELIASFLAMGYWGKTIDSKGTKHVLYITGLLTPLIPLFWLISGNFYFLLFVEAFAGFAWAGFNLSSSNFIFDAVKPENRLRCSAYFKFFESMSIFLGAALGGLIVSNKPSIILIAAIPFVFLLSGILRLFVSLVLLSTLREARLIEVPMNHSFFRKYLSIRPNQGLVFEVLGKYHKFEGKIESAAKVAYRGAKNTKEKITKEIKNQGQYGKSILKFMDKQSNSKKEEKSSVSMAEVERITEEIERGKLR